MLKKIYQNHKAVGVLLGNFDGVHLGHQFLLKEFERLCAERNLTPIIVTFIPHPRVVLSNVKNFLLKTYNQRKEKLNELGLKDIVEIDFNRDFSSLTPESFLEQYVYCPNLKLISVGHDFKFGANKTGTYSSVQSFANKMKIECAQSKQFQINGVTPSSSLIRSLIIEGKLEDANVLLGNYHCLEGIVVKGAQRGTKIGFPTANIDYAAEILAPKKGVYITETIVAGMKYQSVTNIGSNPTFNTDNDIHVETHILDFSRNIYGEKISVYFIRRLRDEVKFSSVNDLIDQIHKDTSDVREFFNSN
jgi:riboflavin kinase/FMN adenylyltransferase